METQPSIKSGIFTIGHSNQPIEVFIELLSKYNIDVLVDTRSSPFSKFSPQFNQDSLRYSVKSAGKKYLFLGRELGGKPKESTYYDQEGYVLYWKIAESKSFQEAITRLKNGIALYTVALLCSEENPIHCHRRLLVGRVLRSCGIEVSHIRSNGVLQTEADLEVIAGTYAKQMTFLSEAEEDEQWKSIQSVLPKKPQLSSLSL
jgi:uncharacterized protein (DUF488 family)